MKKFILGFAVVCFAICAGACTTLSVHDFEPIEVSLKLVRPDVNTFIREREEFDAHAKLVGDDLILTIDHRLYREEVTTSDFEVQYHRPRSAFDKDGLWTTFVFFWLVDSDKKLSYRENDIYLRYVLGTIFTLGVQIVWAVGDWLTLPLRSIDARVVRTESREKVVARREIAVTRKRALECIVGDRDPPRKVNAGPLAFSVPYLWERGFVSGASEVSFFCTDEVAGWAKTLSASVGAFFDRNFRAAESLLVDQDDQARHEGDGRMLTLAVSFYDEVIEEKLLNDDGKAFAAELLDTMNRDSPETKIAIPMNNVDEEDPGMPFYQTFPMMFYDRLNRCVECWASTGRYVLRFRVAGGAAADAKPVFVRFFTRDAKLVLSAIKRESRQFVISGRLLGYKNRVIDLEM